MLCVPNEPSLRHAGSLCGMLLLTGAAVAQISPEIEKLPRSQRSIADVLSSTRISGYVSTSALFNLGPKGVVLPGRTYDGTDKLDKINFDVVNLVLDRPPERGDWTAGYKVELLFGPDANVLGSNSRVGDNSQSDFAIKQAYIALRTPLSPDLTFQLGVFDKIVGYEAFNSPVNPNYTRSYGYFLEPFTHTGVLARYDASSAWSFAGGVAGAYDAPINAEGVEVGNNHRFGLQTFMAQATYRRPEGEHCMDGMTLSSGLVYGLNSNLNSVSDRNPRLLTYVGFEAPTPFEGVRSGFSIDYRTADPAVGGSEYANSVAAYLSWQINETLRLNGRAEYARGSSDTWTTANPSKDRLLGLTSTLDIHLWDDVLARAELRWDNDTNERGVSFGDRDSALTAAFNVVYQF